MGILRNPPDDSYGAETGRQSDGIHKMKVKRSAKLVGITITGQAVEFDPGAADMTAVENVAEGIVYDWNLLELYAFYYFHPPSPDFGVPLYPSPVLVGRRSPGGGWKYLEPPERHRTTEEAGRSAPSPAKYPPGSRDRAIQARRDEEIG